MKKGKGLDKNIMMKILYDRRKSDCWGKQAFFDIN